MSEGIVRPAKTEDAAEIVSIYNHYVTDTCISFEEDCVTESEMARRIEHITESYPWIIYEQNGNVAGYAYASKWKDRVAYRFTGEVTVYVDRNAAGRGIGSILYESLLQEIGKTGLHSLMAVIALPNEASVKLHEKFGFRKVSHFEEVGFKFGRWIDVGYWQLKLAGTGGKYGRIKGIEP